MGLLNDFDMKLGMFSFLNELINFSESGHNFTKFKAIHLLRISCSSVKKKSVGFELASEIFSMSILYIICLIFSLHPSVLLTVQDIITNDSLKFSNKRTVIRDKMTMGQHR